MRIIKGDTKLEAPSWLVLLGIIGVVDVVQIVANAVITKKSGK